MKKTQVMDSAAAAEFVRILKTQGGMTRDKLREKLSDAGYSMSDRQLRHLKEDINEFTEDLIGSASSRKGYFVVNNLDDFEAGDTQFDEQKKDLCVKHSSYRNKFRRKFPELFAKHMEKRAANHDTKIGQTSLLFTNTDPNGGEAWTNQ